MANIRLITIACTGILILASASTSLAAEFTVTNTNDSGVGSLRQAIADANTNHQADTIYFDPAVFSTPQTILITGGELTILRDLDGPSGTVFNLTIAGPGPDLLTLDANNLSRIFRSENGNYTFSFRGMTLKRGFATHGGAVLAENDLVISNARVTESLVAGAEITQGGFLAGLGGGIYADSITISDSLILNNIASGIVQTGPGTPSGSAGAGGGIYIRGFFAQIINCTFTGNSARGMDSPATASIGPQGGWGYGGAVYSGFGVTVVNSTFTSNSATGGNGGAGGSGGKGGGAEGGAIEASGLKILNASFTNNLARGGNGGVSTSNPSLSGNGGDASGGSVYERGNGGVANVTLVANFALGGNGRIGGRGRGGGLYIGNNQWRITNLTITTNVSQGGTGPEGNGAGEGGGVFSAFESVPPTPTFRNNIVAENSAPTGPDVFGFFAGASNNLIRIGAGSTGISHGVDGNQVGTVVSPIDPTLGPLDDNGGVTLTRALLEGSPAINTGNNSVLNPITSQPLAFDQRNFRRITPVAGTIDVGAYEFGSPSTPNATAAPDLRNASDTGTSNSDNITMSTAPVFDIPDVVPGATVDLLRDNVAVASIVATSFSVSLTDPAPPLNGVVQYTARQTIGGQTSPDSSATIVTFDHIAPTGVINQASTQADPTRLLPIVYTAVFSEPIGGFAVSFAGSTANVTNASTSNSNVGGGITWRSEVFGVNSNGDFVVANILAGAYQDLAGNAGLATTSTDNVVTLDNVRPTVTINQSSTQPDPTSTHPVNFVATFSEGVSGFTASDISFTGSTANTTQAIVGITGGPNVYTVSVSNIRSSGTVRVSIPVNAAQDQLGNLSLASTSTDNTVTFNLPRTQFDLDGDGKTDIGIFRPLATAEWWINRSSTGQTFALQFGASTDKIAPADYTGDGKADITFFRPSTGEWYVLRSEDSSFFAFPFGANGDVPVPADYDADGKADFAVFRPSSGTWFISQSGGGGTRIFQFGVTGDVPVVADYDGDAKADAGIFRPAVSGGEWWVQRSTAGLLAMQFGANTDKPVQGDYTGDGKADIALWRPASGEWFIVRSEDFSFYAFPFGANGDTVAPGDYDGDGKLDPTVFRPSAATWFIARSTAGTQIVQFGATGDRPIPNAFVPE